MRKILFSLVVIAVAIGLVAGGTLGSFSDIETSEDNYFATGALDLRVVVDGIEYDQPVPILITTGGAWPCCSKDFTWAIHSNSSGQGTAYAYLHIKDLNCSEWPTDKHPTGRTEPENVSENGGWIGNVWVPGIGPLGQNCSLADYVEVYVEYDTNGNGQLELIYGNRTWGGIGTKYLSDLDCKWLSLGNVPNCMTRSGKMAMHISDLPEEDFGFDFFPNNSPVNDWPTNALMLDQVTFTIEWGLFQQALTPGQKVYYRPTPTPTATMICPTPTATP